MTKKEASDMFFQAFGPRFNEYRKCPGKQPQPQPEPEQQPTDNSQEERKEQE